MHHQEQDALSLALHMEAVGMMRADPALIDRAIAILIRWDKTCDHHSKPLRDEWMRIQTDRLWDIALDRANAAISYVKPRRCPASFPTSSASSLRSAIKFTKPEQ